MEFNFISNSPQETIKIGEKIGSQLRGGEIIGICGQLGSGKTHLIKGIAAGAGAKSSKEVTSPSFVIVNQYTGRLNIYHVDAYRLNSIAEFEMLGFDDFCNPQSVVLIEWADKVKSALKTINHVVIELTHKGPAKRGIRLINVPEYIVL
jgi:tRNA threonylcarbamoyladenosine biosynthesis protein TsaE